MKKEYSSPSTNVVKTESEHVFASSLNVTGDTNLQWNGTVPEATDDIFNSAW